MTPQSTYITTTLMPSGDRSISIRHTDGTIVPLLITKEDLKVYRLYRQGDHFEAVELLQPGSIGHTPELAPEHL